MKKEIRTRYAPSPTGFLHIGGARTALFSYLFAKKNNGKFILRIEDTDIERNVEGGEKNQIEGLLWMGVDIDLYPGKEDEYGPYRQSERLNIYNEYIDLLLKKGIAYKCYCTPEELEQSRLKQKAAGIPSPVYDRKCLKNKNIVEKEEFVIRVQIPDNVSFEWNDGVRGKISIPSSSMGDWIIKKSNGQPTYNFANVVDDHLMKITHVLRGEEHITNTAKQIHLYEIFNWEKPIFSHPTIITNYEGKKLSKRDNTLMQFIHLYREEGFLPEAIFNFLALLGWSPKTEQEFFSKEELIEKFNLEGLSRAPSKFNIDKLIWTNNYYIKKLNSKELFNFLNPFVKDLNISKEEKLKIFLLFQSQLKCGIEIKEYIKLFSENKLYNKFNLTTKNIEVIELFESKIKKLKIFNHENIKETINLVGKEKDVRGKELLFPIRIIVTREQKGPELAKVIEIFGKEKTLKRIVEGKEKND